MDGAFIPIVVEWLRYINVQQLSCKKTNMNFVDNHDFVDCHFACMSFFNKNV